MRKRLYQILRLIYRRVKKVINHFLEADKWLEEERIEEERKFTTIVCDRHCEYPFAMRNVVEREGVSSILDMGCVGSYFPLLLATMGYNVIGIDINLWKVKCRNFQMVVGDIKRACFSDNYFDVITAISTIEHCGLERFGEIHDPAGDIKAVQEIHRILKNDGLFILTLPYGKAFISRYGRIYDRAGFQKLIGNFKVVKQTFYGPVREKMIYVECTEADTYRLGHGDFEYGVTCVVLQK